MHLKTISIKLRIGPIWANLGQIGTNNRPKQKLICTIPIFDTKFIDGIQKPLDCVNLKSGSTKLKIGSIWANLGQLWPKRAN